MMDTILILACSLTGVIAFAIGFCVGGCVGSSVFKEEVEAGYTVYRKRAYKITRVDP